MDFLTIGMLVAAVGAIALFVTYKVKSRKIRAYLTAIENPEPFKSPLAVADALSRVRGVLKNQTFAKMKWTIKSDNPNGMIMAVITFDEDLGPLSSAAKRQIIATVSAINEDQSTVVRVAYNVYATFGRISTDAILHETTRAIEASLL